MDDTLLEQLRQSQERNETLSRELVSLRATLDRVLEEFGALRRDYEALVDATRIITEERNALRQRVAELEAANNRLVDMLWGRRSERRSESPDQQHLNFGDEPGPPPSAEEQEIITAQDQADEARDRELLKRLEAQQGPPGARQGREEFPPTIERRERVLDLPEEQKQGLKPIGVKTSERLRFEKPHMYVEVIKRPQYVVAGQPEKGVQSVPPPLSIVEGCKYDFSVVAAMAGLKFAFHVPTYRQQDWFAQWGWFPSRSTVNDLMNYAVDTIGPLYQQMWQLLLSQPILLGDDTTLCVLLRDGLDEEDLAKLSTRSRFRQALDQGLPPPHSGLPGSAISYAWLYTGLDGLAPYNVFHWSLTHRNAVIDGHLATYRGIFVGDACGAMRVCSSVLADGSFTPVAICTPAASSSRPNRTIRSWRRRRFRSTGSCMMSKSGARRWTPPRATSCAIATRCRSGTACDAGWTAMRRSGRCPAAGSAKRWVIYGTSGRH